MQMQGQAWQWWMEACNATVHDVMRAVCGCATLPLTARPPPVALQFGFARRVTLPKAPGSRGSSSGSGADPPAAASQPASLATDDTPLALGQVCDRWQAAWLG